MPMVYPFLALLPAPEYLFPIQLSVEVDESRLEPLEHAPDLLELEHVLVDLARDVVDAAAQRELVRRFAPFGSSLRRHELVLRHEITPARVERDQIGDDALDERASTIGFGEGEVLSGHTRNLLGAKGRVSGYGAKLPSEREVSGCGVKPPSEQIGYAICPLHQLSQPMSNYRTLNVWQPAPRP